MEATDQYSDALARSEKWIVRNGVGIQAMETLAVGAFLTALAVELGASNAVIGALAAVPHLAQLAQLPAVYTVDRLRARKRIYLVSGWVARPMLLVIAAAAWFLDGAAALSVILVAFTVRYVAGAFLSCSWNSWIRDLVPDRQMGRVFSGRQRSMIAVGIVLSLLAAGLVDAWKTWAPYPVTVAYGIVYCLAFFGGAYAVLAARHIVEPPMASHDPQPLLTRLRSPFRHKNYKRLIRFLASWNFAINLAAPFFTVHMLKRMELDLVWVIGFATLSQIAAYLTVTNWGRIADVSTNKAVLRVCGSMFVVAIFAWTFTTMPDMHAGTVPLLIAIHIATGIASAGVNLAGGNIAMKLAPQGDATPFLAAGAMVNALAAGSAALIGGVTADLFATWELSLTLHWASASKEIALEAMHFSHWDFFFLFATLVGIYALHRLSLVEEDGEVDEPRIVRTFVSSARQSLRNLSTVAGLRAASSFPVDELLDDRPAEPEPDPPEPKPTG